jgi:hypothetical protein
MNRPVPAPIHTKSFNFWKTKFRRNGHFFAESAQYRASLSKRVASNGPDELCASRATPITCPATRLVNVFEFRQNL